MTRKIENYKNYITTLIEEKKAQIKSLESQDCQDEADHCKIELNVMDIFQKMLTVSVNQSQNKSEDELKETYLAFFEKIPKNWHENRLKSMDHGLEEAVFIEDLKIQQANQLKSKFIEMVG